MRVWLCLLLAGCPKPAGLDVLPLPEAASTVAQQEPAAILEEAARGLEPSPRARALWYLIVTSEEAGGGDWAATALADPNAWVQRSAVDALLKRLPERASQDRLAAFVRRDAPFLMGDPYVRSHAAVRLAPDAALGEALAEAWQGEAQVWRQAPLALAALVHGQASAEAPLAAALRRGEVALETGFLLDVGRSGQPSLVAAVKEGADWIEEEMALAYAVARVGLGDGSGEQLIRHQFSEGDDTAKLEALDYVCRMKEPVAIPLLRKARGAGPDVVRAYAELCLAARGLEDVGVFEVSLSNPDPEIRIQTMRLAAEALDGGTVPRRSVKGLTDLLRRGLSDEAASVRTEALRAVTTVRLEGARSLVSPQLSDDYLANRVEAAGSMLVLAKEG